MYSRIQGTGSCLPDKVVTNDDLSQRMDTSDEWIRVRTGVRERHIAEPDETTCDLAETAARRALEASGVSAGELSMIVMATTTPDLVFPNTACLLQERLDAGGCAAFDLQAACSGFTYGLSIADKFVRGGGNGPALVVGAETLSRMIDWEDRSTAVLFGDGAGAVVLGASEEPGLLGSHLHADGAYKHLAWTDVGVSKGFTDGPNGGIAIRLRGTELFKFAVRKFEELAKETLEAAGLGLEEVDWFIPHQANERITRAVASALGLPDERVISTIGHQANTSAATIPLALDEFVRAGRISRGDLILMEAFGSGATWGSVLLRC